MPAVEITAFPDPAVSAHVALTSAPDWHAARGTAHDRRRPRDGRTGRRASAPGGRGRAPAPRPRGRQAGAPRADPDRGPGATQRLGRAGHLVGRLTRMVEGF